MVNVFKKASEFIPFKKVGNKVIVSWGFTPYVEKVLDEEGNPTGETKETEYAEWYQQIYSKTPWSLDHFKQIIKTQCSKDIDEKLKEFRYNDILVSLTEEAKFNFLSCFSMAQVNPESSFPQTFRMNSVEENQFYTFNDISEFGDFINAAMTHIKESYAAGWTAEATFDFSPYEGEPIEAEE